MLLHEDLDFLISQLSLAARSIKETLTEARSLANPIKLYVVRTRTLGLLGQFNSTLSTLNGISTKGYLKNKKDRRLFIDMITGGPNLISIVNFLEAILE
jgi:hypothetical protein